MMSRDHVNDDDVDVAVSIMLDSFTAAQKHAVKIALRKQFNNYIIRPDENFSVIL